MGITAIKKVTLGNKICDVIDQTEYHRRLTFDNPMLEDTCIEVNGTVYPIQKRYDPSKPGAFDSGAFFKLTKPSEEEQEMYSSENIIDMARAKDYKDRIDAQDDLRTAENAILTTVNNIFNPVTYEDDSPELKALKEVYRSKQIDLESYRHRYGSDSDFNNETRTVRSKSQKTVSFYKVRKHCDVLDVEAILILKDKKGAINPMGKTIITRLTSEE